MAEEPDQLDDIIVEAPRPKRLTDEEWAMIVDRDSFFFDLHDPAWYDHLYGVVYSPVSFDLELTEDGLLSVIEYDFQTATAHVQTWGLDYDRWWMEYSRPMTPDEWGVSPDPLPYGRWDIA